MFELLPRDKLLLPTSSYDFLRATASLVSQGRVQLLSRWLFLTWKEARQILLDALHDLGRVLVGVLVTVEAGAGSVGMVRRRSTTLLSVRQHTHRHIVSSVWILIVL